MRYDSWLEEISARPAYLLLAFFVFLFAMHFVLVRWLKLDDIAWKRVDYIWLGAAALGLLAASAQAERILSERYLDTQKLGTATAYLYLRETLAGPPGVCLQRVRSEYSPPNFDDILKEQEDICEKAKAVAARMEPQPDEYLPLEETGYKPVGDRAVYEHVLIKEIARQAQGYAAQQARYARLKVASQESDLELLFKILGPLLIAFALALRITKVTGEIANARAKSKSTA